MKIEEIPDKKKDFYIKGRLKEKRAFLVELTWMLFFADDIMGFYTDRHTKLSLTVNYMYEGKVLSATTSYCNDEDFYTDAKRMQEIMELLDSSKTKEYYDGKYGHNNK
jgi:hypothetical protein